MPVDFRCADGSGYSRAITRAACCAQLPSSFGPSQDWHKTGIDESAAGGLDWKQQKTALFGDLRGMGLDNGRSFRQGDLGAV